MLSIIAIFTNDELVDRRDEFHLLRAQYLLQLVVCLIIVFFCQIYQVLVRCDERNVTKHVLKVNTQRLNSVAH